MAGVRYKAPYALDRTLAGIRFIDGVGTAETDAQARFCERRGFAKVSLTAAEKKAAKEAAEAEEKAAKEARAAEAAPDTTETGTADADATATSTDK